MGEYQQLLPIVEQIRQDHPRISAKKMYKMIKPETMGRDRFEVFCFENGFKVQSRRNPQRTTNSLGVTRFENKIQGRELTAVNQVLVSDITYFRIHDKYYYLTFITDFYSRKILGYNASKRLLSEETTIPSLKMAIKSRKYNLSNAIMHSDGGGQYYCKEFIQLTRKYQMINSMGTIVYENACAERINGIIKNEYLYCYNPQNFEQLVKMLKKAVDMYNNARPHKSLKYLTPSDFENMYNCN